MKLIKKIIKSALKKIIGNEIYEKQIFLEGIKASLVQKKIKKIKDFSEIEFSVFSQWGDDGIIHWLVENLPCWSLPPLPPGSALKFGDPVGAGDKRFPTLLQNLEGEMSRLLEWASAGDQQGRRRSRFDAANTAAPTHTAEIRREEFRDFLFE